MENKPMTPKEKAIGIAKEIKYLDSLGCRYRYDYCDPKHCICSKKSKLKIKETYYKETYDI
jgi:hypothetical protein